MLTSYENEILLFNPSIVRADYPNLWLTILTMFPDLPPEGMAKVASLVLQTCDICHNASSRYCECWLEAVDRDR